MKPVRIAQIGAYHDHAGATIGAAVRRRDLFEVVGYAIPEDEPPAPQFPALFWGIPRLGVEEILNDPTVEAVLIETTEGHLTKYARLAAMHGKAVHMDKPGGGSQEEFDDLIECVKGRKLPFHMGYMYRYNPAIVRVREWVRAGTLGEILYAEYRMNCRHNAEKRAWLGGLPGGEMFYLGCHLVDLALTLQGEPEEIIPLNTASGMDGSDALDQGMAVFRYPRGVTTVASTATEIGGYHRRETVIVGTKATATVSPMEYMPGELDDLKNYTDLTLSTDPDWHAGGEKITFGPFGRYDAMLEEFASVVRGADNPWPYDYEKTVFHTLLRACGK